jgi:hypothetical protein
MTNVRTSDKTRLNAGLNPLASGRLGEIARSLRISKNQALNDAIMEYPLDEKKALLERYEQQEQASCQ